MLVYSIQSLIQPCPDQIGTRCYYFFQLHILIQVMNMNSEWPGPRIGPKIILFHLSAPTGSLQPVLTSLKCTSIHPKHTSLCLVKCIAEAQLYCLSHPMSNKVWWEENESNMVDSLHGPCDHRLSICQWLAQHQLTHRGTQ